MTNARPPDDMCKLLEAWILAQLPDPADPRAIAMARASARTFTIVFPPAIRKVWIELPADPP